METKLYWLAQVRGADFANLHRLGFITLFPTSDDYAFLEAIEANRKLVNRQLQLGLEFLTAAGKLATITQAELDQMGAHTPVGLQIGHRVSITDGIYANLEGEVATLGASLTVCLRGWSRTYVVQVSRTQVSPLDGYSYEMRTEI